jgi:hypothetical protein
MGSLRDGIKKAFAVDPPGPAEPTPEQQPAVDWFCRQVAKRRLTTPGIVALELARPLNFVASQMMHVAAPAVWAMARPETHEHYEQFARFLEHRGALEYLECRIEELDAEYQQQEARRRAAGASPEQDEDRGSE